MGELKTQTLGDGITLIEGWYEREGMCCSYLLQQGEDAVLIDTGTARVSTQILQLLQRLEIAPERLRYIIPTHVHLDHAGGAGQLMAALPEAQLVVHPKGARHLIDPARLQAGAAAVYGEVAFAEKFDTLLPIDSGRVIEMEPGMSLDLNGRALQLIDTPGHALHHLCVWDECSAGHFTGDVFGNGYPELVAGDGSRYLTPVTSPTQFDPAAWHETIDRLLAFQPRQVYLTHYGVLKEPERYGNQLHHDLDRLAAMAQVLPSEGRYERLQQQVNDYHRRRVTEIGCTVTDQELARLIHSDNELTAQGLAVWMQRLEKGAR